ncbi:hypothetical protein SLEP1_g31291 [Rubroshorea leprosula]|uniref:Uncharacterized protein n=1 Tax=Rubroshorea leprosula TaxID=152421 RepID=A0AAV5KAL6_9ROSI|nr:hypothetical protein SLEP1_g31291 [Rubroshorea leprosula]
MGFKRERAHRVLKGEHIVEYKKGQLLKISGGRTSEKKSEKQPAESLKVSLRQSLRGFCASDGRCMGSRWDTSGYRSEFYKLGFCSSRFIFPLFGYGIVVHQFNLRFYHV